jgi:diguanylate cyclase (GGDEF)-like protein/PAS domain S-box-containing protein
MIFLAWLPPGITLDHPPQMAWLIPFLFWAGLRTGRRNTVLIQLMFLLQAMASAHLGVGLFANHHGLANFWAAAFTLSLLGLSLAILTDERLRSALQIALHAKVFALSTDGIIIVDAQSRIISVNAGFTRISGYALSDVQGKKPSFYASGRHDRAFYHRMWTTLVETGQWQGEIWNRSQSGALYLINLTIQTVMNANGEVVNRIGMFSNITESRAIQEAVTHQAQHDFLTGLPNRQLFSDRFGQQLAHARRNNAKFAVIYLDLDGFKSVNDTLGHTTGDQLLIAVAQRLQAMVREIDTVSRFGGDEFAMLVSEVSHNSDVTTMADKVLTALAEPYLLNDHTVRVTASLGLAIYPYHGNDMDSLINAADAALLEAKVDGKNAWQLSDFELTEAEQADVFARNASNARGY